MAQARPTRRLHQWLLRHPAPRPRQGAYRCARRLRPADRRAQQRRLGASAEGRGPPRTGRACARRGAGGAGGGRPRRRLRGGHADQADRACEAKRAGEGRRLYARVGCRPRDRRGQRRRSAAGRHSRRPQHDLTGEARPRGAGMNGVAAAPASHPSDWWRRVRNPALWMPAADAFAVLTALTLPWSTSLVSIFALLWLGSTALIVDYPAWFRSLKQPICALPLALFALAAVGMLWSEASWAARVNSLGQYTKLLLL